MPYAATSTILVHAHLERVWDAQTKPEIVKQYFFGTDQVTDWTVGSPIYFRGEWQGKRYEDRGTVLSFQPMTSLSFNYWSSFSGLDDRPELRQIIRYDLAPADDGIRVTVTQTNVDTQERADHSASNWTGVLAGMKTLLESPKSTGATSGA